MDKLPGGELASRPLHFIWIVDCSGSMGAGGKIEALNNAIDEATPAMRQAADENPNAKLLVRAIRFSNGAQWHIGEPVPIDAFRWSPLTADGVTDLGRALSEVADQLSMEKMPSRALPPVLILLSDGLPTDDYKAGLRQLMAQPWGRKAVRIAIAIGRDADHNCLQEFIGHPEIQPLQANNAERLTQLIKWSSTVVVQQASSPASQAANSEPGSSNIATLQPPVDMDAAGAASDVW